MIALTNFHHLPVLLEETVESLRVRAGGTYVDCTIGGGGHAEAILKEAPGVTLIGFDQDPVALKAARQRLTPYADQITLVGTNFRNLDSILRHELGIDRVDGILMDLGVSSVQLDQAERGFSYNKAAALDMRMDPTQELTAADLINTLSEGSLTEIIGNYGEERWAKRIARFIVEWRNREPLVTTKQLVDLIEAAIPARARRTGPHPARRTFQALRIAVNDELGALQETLYKAVDLLAPQGRISVISFHSLEDRIVKDAFREMADPCTCPPRIPVCVCGRKPKIRLVNKKPIQAGPREVEGNPRSRSAKLRTAERL